MTIAVDVMGEGNWREKGEGCSLKSTSDDFPNFHLELDVDDDYDNEDDDDDDVDNDDNEDDYLHVELDGVHAEDLVADVGEHVAGGDDPEPGGKLHHFLGEGIMTGSEDGGCKRPT